MDNDVQEQEVYIRAAIVQYLHASLSGSTTMRQIKSHLTELFGPDAVKKHQKAIKSTVTLYVEGKEAADAYFAAGLDPNLLPPADAILRLITEAQSRDIMRFVRAHPESRNYQNSMGQSPLGIATYWAKSEVTRFLLDAQADPNISNILGMTPLHNICQQATPQQPEEFLLHAGICVEALLENGANPWLKNNKGEKPAEVAMFAPIREILQGWELQNAGTALEEQLIQMAAGTLDRRLPVTVLSGFLGAGKTTLLKKILRNPAQITDPQTGEQRSRKIALIVNDMGEMNLDAQEIKNAKLVQEDMEMVEMHNGCICCTLRGDLLKSVKRLSEEALFDYLVIESTGISEPLPVAQTFCLDMNSLSEQGRSDISLQVAMPEPVMSLSNLARLDTLVTIVDAVNIYEILASIETLAAENKTGMTGNRDANNVIVDDRSIVQLFVDQLEFANVIVLSKAQIVTGAEKGSTAYKEGLKKIKDIEFMLRKLNPKASVVVPMGDQFADLDTEKFVMNTKLFDMEKAASSRKWIEELEAVHVPETEEYGIGSAVFRTNQMPFHPKRFRQILDGMGSYTSATESATCSKEKISSRAKVFSDPRARSGLPMRMHTRCRITQLAGRSTCRELGRLS